MYNQDPGEVTCLPFSGNRNGGKVGSDISPFYLKPWNINNCGKTQDSNGKKQTSPNVQL